MYASFLIHLSADGYLGWFHVLAIINSAAMDIGVHEQTFGLYGRRWGWDDLREKHWNMYIIKCETDPQSRLDAWDKCSGLVHWDHPEGWDGEGSGRGDENGEHM